MPHDVKGRLVEAGDHLKCKVYVGGAQRPTIGRVSYVDVQSGPDATCNAMVAYLVPGYQPVQVATVTLKECELVLKADGSPPSDVVPPGPARRSVDEAEVR